MANDADDVLGRWWLPASPGRKLPGNVDFGKRHPALRVLGTFDPGNTPLAFALGTTEYDLIYGHAIEQDYTIVDAHRSTFSASRVELSEKVDVRGYIAVGTHLHSPDADFVAGIRVTANGLGHWLGAGPTDVDDGAESDEAELISYTVNARVPNFHPFEVLPGVWLGTDGSADHRFFHTPTSSIAEFTGTANLCLRYDQPTTFRTASEHASIALDLVTILSGHTARQTSKEIQVAGNDNWIRIIESGRPELDAKTNDPRARQLLHSSDINVEELFKGWFRLNSKDGRPGINVLLAGAYNDNGYVETALQNAMTSADRLYRSLAKRHAELPAKVPWGPEMLKSIIEAEKSLPSHLHVALRSKKARPANAHERLTHLLEWVGPANFSTIVSIDEQPAWVTLAVRCRNDITHDGNFKEHVDTPGLMAISIGMRWLLTLAILRDIGYPVEQLGTVRGKQRNEAEYTTREYLSRYLKSS